MELIRFRRLSRPAESVKVAHSEAVRFSLWEIAFDENDLHRKLDGEMAEIIMPAKPWFVRLWRLLVPLRGVEM